MAATAESFLDFFFVFILLVLTLAFLFLFSSGISLYLSVPIVYFNSKASSNFLFLPVIILKLEFIPEFKAFINPTFPPDKINCSPSLINSLRNNVFEKETIFGFQSRGRSSSQICSVLSL